MRSFFVKVNATSVPKSIGHPRSAAEWEGGDLIVPAARRLTGREDAKTSIADDPLPGDQLQIYVNTNRDLRGGLAAVATVEALAYLEKNRRRIKIRGLRLFEKPWLTFVGSKNDRKFARGEIEIPARGFLEALHQDRRSKTLQIEPCDLKDVVAVLAQLGDVSLKLDQTGRVVLNSTSSAKPPREPDGDRLSQREEELLIQDLDYRLEGETAERKRTIRKRVALIARQFILKRTGEQTLFCDNCAFDPSLPTNGSGVEPRSLLDVHHMVP
ncbi:hypothetical protein [Bradyrhizobium sp. CCBAU 53380]|uniref:hypothetical protein n=1 Tax=Bradyrhizobium sp. CCBAU 53380 TaxID=1325117 RepID=UPI00230251E1|nr:hypothetical protein [Bradyrhizobium sp. CCBAU 53380]